MPQYQATRTGWDKTKQACRRAVIVNVNVPESFYELSLGQRGHGCFLAACQLVGGRRWLLRCRVRNDVDALLHCKLPPTTA